MCRITRPAIQVLGHRKEATGDSPLFFDFTAVHKCQHLCGVCRRGIASTWKRWGIEYSCEDYGKDAEGSAGLMGRGVGCRVVAVGGRRYS